MDDSGSASTRGQVHLRRWAPLAGLALACIAMAVFGTVPHVGAKADGAADTDASRPLVVYVLPKRGKDSADITFPASLHALQETTVYARTSGYVKHWLAEMGDHVKAGQLLAEIETPEVDRELDQVRAGSGQARAHLGLARSTAERYRQLLKDEAVSPQDADEKIGALAAREADLAAMQARVRQLESMKAFQRVVAPFGGTVTARNVEIGSLVNPGSAASNPWLYKIVQSETLRVLVSVPQNHLSAIAPGTEAELLVRELGGRPIAAKVVRNAGAFDPVTRTIVTELRVPNPGGRILPGMYGQVTFQVKYPEAPLVVPINALMVGGAGLRVSVVDEQNVVHIRPVKLGRDLGKEVEILDGLGENERVIGNPRDDLSEGSRVRSAPAPKRDEKKSAGSTKGTEPTKAAR